MFYMFQAVPPPIIRSSGYFVKPFLLPTTVVEEMEPSLPRQWQVTVKV